MVVRTRGLFKTAHIFQRDTLCGSLMSRMVAVDELPAKTGGVAIWGHLLLYRIPTSIVQASAWGLILYAAFGEGSGPRSKYLVEDGGIEPQAD